MAWSSPAAAGCAPSALPPPDLPATWAAAHPPHTPRSAPASAATIATGISFGSRGRAQSTCTHSTAMRGPRQLCMRQCRPGAASLFHGHNISRRDISHPSFRRVESCWADAWSAAEKSQLVRGGPQPQHGSVGNWLPLALPARVNTEGPSALQSGAHLVPRLDQHRFGRACLAGRGRPVQAACAHGALGGYAAALGHQRQRRFVQAWGDGPQVGPPRRELPCVAGRPRGRLRRGRAPRPLPTQLAGLLGGRCGHLHVLGTRGRAIGQQRGGQRP